VLRSALHGRRPPTLVLRRLPPGRLAPATPAEQVATLLHELERYEPELLSRPRLVVGVRADLVVERDRPPCSSYGGTHVVSAVTGEGLAELLASMASAVTKQRSRSPRLRTLPVVRRPLPDGVEVVRNDAVFVVKGRAAERAVALSDLTNAAALAEVERRLRRLGVDRALRRAGARPGDRVEIGSMHFDYESDR
jgi:GTP-binding protein